MFLKNQGTSIVATFDEAQTETAVQNWQHVEEEGQAAATMNENEERSMGDSDDYENVDYAPVIRIYGSATLTTAQNIAYGGVAEAQIKVHNRNTPTEKVESNSNDDLEYNSAYEMSMQGARHAQYASFTTVTPIVETTNWLSDQWKSCLYLKPGPEVDASEQDGEYSVINNFCEPSVIATFENRAYGVPVLKARSSSSNPDISTVNVRSISTANVTNKSPVNIHAHKAIVNSSSTPSALDQSGDTQFSW